MRISRTICQRPLHGDSSVGGIAPWPDSEEAGWQSERGLAATRDSAATLGLVKAGEAMDTMQERLLCDEHT